MPGNLERERRYVIEKMSMTPYTYETVCVLALMWETKASRRPRQQVKCWVLCSKLMRFYVAGENTKDFEKAALELDRLTG